MNDQSDIDQAIAQHHLALRNDRRFSLKLWLVLTLACLGICASIVLSFDALQKQSMLWVLIFPVASVCLVIYFAHELGQRNKLLWPERMQDLKTAFERKTN